MRNAARRKTTGKILLTTLSTISRCPHLPVSTLTRCRLRSYLRPFSMVAMSGDGARDIGTLPDHSRPDPAGDDDHEPNWGAPVLACKDIFGHGTQALYRRGAMRTRIASAHYWKISLPFALLRTLLEVLFSAFLLASFL